MEAEAGRKGSEGQDARVARQVHHRRPLRVEERRSGRGRIWQVHHRQRVWAQRHQPLRQREHARAYLRRTSMPRRAVVDGRVRSSNRTLEAMVALGHGAETEGRTAAHLGTPMVTRAC